MGRLTTHILDIMSGKPAAGVIVELFAVDGGEREMLAKAVTNADGRCEKPLLAEDAFQAGTFELVFHVGKYFAATGTAVTEPPFLDKVPVRFTVTDAEANTHVPLLVSAYGYSTYSGS